mgnify:CR=1 FL=1
MCSKHSLFTISGNSDVAVAIGIPFLLPFAGAIAGGAALLAAVAAAAAAAATDSSVEQPSAHEPAADRGGQSQQVGGQWAHMYGAARRLAIQLFNQDLVVSPPTQISRQRIPHWQRDIHLVRSCTPVAATHIVAAPSVADLSVTVCLNAGSPQPAAAAAVGGSSTLAAAATAAAAAAAT